MIALKRRPFSRGATILAALVAVVVLGGFAAAFQSANIAANRQALVAATGIGSDTIASEQKKAANELAQKCAAAITQAKASGKEVTSKVGQTANDDCVAAIKTNDPAYKNTNGYKCVGKSAQVLMNSNGTININWQARQDVPPGKCVTVACQPKPTEVQTMVGIKGTTAKCVPTELTNISPSALKAALDSPAAFTASMNAVGVLGIGNGYLIPETPLNQSGLDILNKAFGKDPNDTTGYISLDSKGDLTAPAADRIAQIASDNPDAAAQAASQAVSADVCRSNPTLCTDTATLSPDQAPCPGSPGCPGNPATPPPPGAKEPKAPPSGPGGRDTTGFQGSGNPTSGSGSNPLASLLSGLMSAFKPTPQQAPAQTCSTDQNTYTQQQQQYQQELQQYNYQLQQYNYQQQLDQYNRNNYGGQSSYASQQPPPVQPRPCTPGTGGQCSAQPPRPDTASCTVGSWQPVYSGACVTNWKCAGPNGAPIAQISCQPEVADAGMTLAIAYSCSSGTASSSAFTVTTQPAGSATTTVASPPAGTNTATYTLTCTDEGKTSGAQCSVQVGKPSIILVGNPKTVALNGISLLGWITSGMESCVISSPDQADFTARNSYNTSPNGAATTSPISSQASFLLHCVTLAGGTKDATTTISVTP